MAALTFQAVLNEDNTHTVTRSTADAIGAATAALVVDNTATKIDVMNAVRALFRHMNRQNAKTSAPSSIATTGSDLE